MMLEKGAGDMSIMDNEELWPDVFSVEGFQYDLTDPTIDYHLMLADIFLTMGHICMGKIPPVNFIEGISTCLRSLENVIEQSKKKEKRENLLEVLNRVTFENLRPHFGRKNIDDEMLSNVLIRVRKMIREDLPDS